jgi:hypothetical protein
MLVALSVLLRVALIVVPNMPTARSAAAAISSLLDSDAA